MAKVSRISQLLCLEVSIRRLVLPATGFRVYFSVVETYVFIFRGLFVQSLVSSHRISVYIKRVTENRRCIGKGRDEKYPSAYVCLWSTNVSVLLGELSAVLWLALHRKSGKIMVCVVLALKSMNYYKHSYVWACISREQLRVSSKALCSELLSVLLRNGYL